MLNYQRVHSLTHVQHLCSEPCQCAGHVALIWIYPKSGHPLMVHDNNNNNNNIDNNNNNNNNNNNTTTDV